MPDTLIDQMMQNSWWWLGLAVLLGIGELLTPGVFLIWIALAAGLTGVAALLLPLSLALQFLLFALLCLASVWAGRRWYVDNPVASQDPLLNDRVARLVGEVVTVAEPIERGQGRVRVGDGVWDCAGPDSPQGASVRITGARGTVLLVEAA